jgi:hypothetical protein
MKIDQVGWMMISFSETSIVIFNYLCSHHLGADLTSLILLYWNKLLLPHLTNMESSVRKGGALLQENNAATPSNALWVFYAEVLRLLGECVLFVR